MLFHGPPGVGKTMLAERAPGLLPELDFKIRCATPWRMWPTSAS